MSSGSDEKPRRVGTLESLRAALASRRLGAVAIQSFASGLPLGLVWIALPAWLTYRGVDIKTVGLFSLSQAPWTFKFLWAPLMDRFSPGFLGRKRSWMIVSQLFLLAGIAFLATQSSAPRVGLVAAIAIFIAFWSASQDIAIDGYAVEVLRPEEMGMAVGARVALYRAAVLLAGAVAITVGQRMGWTFVFVTLALLYLPLAGAVVWSPEPPPVSKPPRTLRDAVFEPLIGIFRKSRALEIIAFLLLYKFGENLATALTRPFLIQKCFSPEDVGLATATIGLIAIIGGTFFGAWTTDRVGLGRALWIFGITQAVGFLGYIVVDRMTPGVPCAGGAAGAISQAMASRLVMYGSVGVENLCQGMANGAFGVLLLRLTQKQFSATQYALFSSVFALGRTLAGPPAGFLVDAIGWTPFFLVSVGASVPGLFLLSRFAPIDAREADLDVEDLEPGRPVTRGRLAAWSALAGVIGWLGAVSISSLLAALKQMRAHPGSRFPFAAELARLLSAHTTSDWLRLIGPAAVGLVVALAAAALIAARRGVAAEPDGSR
ncbi:MAG: MFS transporter [Acidobacteria bacterium]|nr:MFS transporter [Acidobacteriota bacterium]MCA1617487.1 MFS transporter [Acidobacteriota bacterium]